MSRPTRFKEADYKANDALKKQNDTVKQLYEEMPRQRNENSKEYMAYGLSETKFLVSSLLPIICAAFILTLWISARFNDISKWTLILTLTAAIGAGGVAYAVAWFATRPWKTKSKSKLVQCGDCIAWLVAGGAFGAAVGLGVQGLIAFNISENGKVFVLTLAGVPWIILAYSMAEMIFVGLTSMQAGSDQDREWFGRSNGWYAAVGIGWLALMSLVVIGPIVVHEIANIDSKTYKTWLTTAAAVIGPLSGIVSAVLGHSSGTPAKSEAAGWTGLSLNIVLAITVPIFLASLIIGLSVGIDWSLLGGWLFDWRRGRVSGAAGSLDWFWLLIGLGITGTIGVFASLCININWFSMHSLYRNRLIRAFLGASHALRRPNPFTGFDQKDNPQVAELWPLKKDWPPRGDKWRPFHVINVALNLVSSKRLAWQERKAASFIMSPLHCGSALDGKTPMFRRTEEYGFPKGAGGLKRDAAQAQEEDKRKCGISLGTAMAISGAAASPNMGYHSSPMVTLVLALFNVRLGWWLGNPGECGDKPCGRFRAYQMESPRWSIKPFLAEMIGKTSDDRPFVYLSDGGHFENLGLYEMVRRRCRYILVSDAGCDPDFAFEDLGNAVRKISIDLGVTIKFDGIHELKCLAQNDKIDRQAKGEARARAVDDRTFLYASGVIDYGHDEQGNDQHGYIIYVKPIYCTAIVRNVGIRSYAMAHPAFPHESTANQFFSESQFESYRALGFDIMDDVLTRGASVEPDPRKTMLAQIIEKLNKNAADRRVAKK